ncbi:hypothetical protein [Halegenticoccus soli]|uniref:hypothetical protein n=1 Tax=Halegenticoccus soli TaxID=1985678 RepID=UPI000C6DA8DB|nr:hypothetical protein [Halegenticoccus soli]
MLLDNESPCVCPTRIRDEFFRLRGVLSECVADAHILRAFIFADHEEESPLKFRRVFCATVRRKCNCPVYRARFGSYVRFKSCFPPGARANEE